MELLYDVSFWGDWLEGNRSIIEDAEEKGYDLL